MEVSLDRDGLRTTRQDTGSGPASCTNLREDSKVEIWQVRGHPGHR